MLKLMTNSVCINEFLFRRLITPSTIFEENAYVNNLFSNPKLIFN